MKKHLLRYLNFSSKLAVYSLSGYDFSPNFVRFFFVAQSRIQDPLSDASHDFRCSRWPKVNSLISFVTHHRKALTVLNSFLILHSNDCSSLSFEYADHKVCVKIIQMYSIMCTKRFRKWTCVMAFLVFTSFEPFQCGFAFHFGQKALHSNHGVTSNIRNKLNKEKYWNGRSIERLAVKIHSLWKIANLLDASNIFSAI